MSYDVITIGDCMEDIFIFPSVEEMEKPLSGKRIESEENFEKYLVFGLGDKITISDVVFAIGGAAANISVGLSRLGFKVGMISAIGGDDGGNQIINKLKKEKVSLENIKVYRGKKSSFSVILSYRGERTIFVYHSFAPTNFLFKEEIRSRWLYLGPMAKGFESIYNKVVSMVIKNDLKVVLNPGAIQIKKGLESFGGLSKLLEIIFLNREEAQELAGLKGVVPIRDIAKIIHLKGPKIVVITCGKEGAYVYNGEFFLKVGSFPGHRLDATGAGDAFAAGFLASIISGNNLQASLKWGVVNSASVVQKIGAQEGLLRRQTIQGRVKEYRWPADTLRFS